MRKNSSNKRKMAAAAQLNFLKKARGTILTKRNKCAKVFYGRMCDQKEAVKLFRGRTVSMDPKVVSF